MRELNYKRFQVRFLNLKFIDVHFLIIFFNKLGLGLIIFFLISWEVNEFG